MADKEKFSQIVKEGYSFKGESFKIGSAMLDGEVISGADVVDPI